MNSEQLCEFVVRNWVNNLNSGTSTTNDVLFQLGAQNPLSTLILNAYSQDISLSYSIGNAAATQRVIAFIRDQCQQPAYQQAAEQIGQTNG